MALGQWQNMQDMHQNNQQQDAKRWVSETRQKARQATQQDISGGVHRLLPKQTNATNMSSTACCQQHAQTEAAWRGFGRKLLADAQPAHNKHQTPPGNQFLIVPMLQTHNNALQAT
jgi:hypothetical protein